MYSETDLPGSIPVFPLPGALLLPRAKLPLHIFEPRYLAMFDDVLKTQPRLIGMVQPLPEPKGPDGLHSVGCAGRVTGFSESEDGRYRVTLTGISRFKVIEEIEGFTPYRKCAVSWDGFEKDLGSAEHDPELDRVSFLALLKRYFTSVDLKTDWGSIGDADDELLINSLAMLCPFDPEDKQALLEAFDLVERRKTLTTLLDYAQRRGPRNEVMQ